MNIKRPYVHLESENTIEILLNALKSSLNCFTVEGVIGIILDGGLSRGYGDHLSEIDVVVYLEEGYFNKYQDGICPFPLGIAMIDDFLYDIKILDFEVEKQKTYDSVTLWDLSYAKILYDPKKQVTAFMKEKLKEPISGLSAGGLMWEAWWHYKLAGDIWIHRGDILQAHYILNLAIRPLLGALFILNEEYIPHDKWLIHMSRSLPWTPENWDTLLTGAISTGDNSCQSLKYRHQCIDAIWKCLDKKICSDVGFNTGLSITQKESYDSLLQLTTKDTYTIAEWEEMTSLNALNYEPVRSIFYQDGDQIVFNKEKLLNLCPSDMYSWMYEIANAVRKDKTNK